MEIDGLELPPARRLSFSRSASGFAFVFGVLLPVAALVFELLTHGCAELLFDPIPTWLHVALVAWVPLANFWLLKKTWDGAGGDCPGSLLLINGSAMLVSGVYAAAFLPVSHAAVIGILVFGLGALALAPLCSFIVAFLLWRRLTAWRGARPVFANLALWYKPFCAGILCVVLLALAAETPRFATYLGVEMQSDQSEVQRERGMWLLRTIGSESMLLEACYGEQWGIYQSLNLGMSREEARKLFYRVTGVPFNRSPLSQDGFFTFRGGRESRWDADLGGTQVGQIVEDVALASSRMDGVLYPADGVGYIEWTMVFRNDSTWQDREARFALKLPAGGVCSRVTLWVNGEPREAAFGSTAKVRQAYTNVAVRQRRDPLLVTSLGPDQVLAQCFPVLPGEEMKIRLGFSCPLEADETGQWMALPEILERNFLFDPGLEHSLWIESPGNLTLMNTMLPRGEQTIFEHDLRAELSDAQLRDSDGIRVNVPRGNESRAYSPLEQKSYQVEFERHVASGSVRVVVDGSMGMRDHLGDVLTWLEGRQQVELWLASDTVASFAGTGSEAAKWLRSQRLVGGQDSLPALEDAMLEAMDEQGAGLRRVWWFYAGQPVLLASPDRLGRLFEREDPRMGVIACPLGDAVNRLRERPPLAYSPTAEGKDFAWQSVQLEQLDVETVGNAGPGQEHLFRVAVAEDARARLAELFRKQATMKPSVYQHQLSDLAKRAAALQIVTPVSGAVVLETQAQYDENDLQPVDPDSVPNVPEPKIAAFFIGLLTLLFIVMRKQKLKLCAAK